MIRFTDIYNNQYWVNPDAIIYVVDNGLLRTIMFEKHFGIQTELDVETILKKIYSR